jgi:hypothetical protein
MPAWGPTSTPIPSSIGIHPTPSSSWSAPTPATRTLAGSSDAPGTTPRASRSQVSPAETRPLIHRPRARAA